MIEKVRFYWNRLKDVFTSTDEEEFSEYGAISRAIFYYGEEYARQQLEEVRSVLHYD